MSLFGGLPAPAKRPADGSGEDAQHRSKTPRLDAPGAPPEPSVADLEELEEEERGAQQHQQGGPAADGYAAAIRAEQHPQHQRQEQEEADALPPAQGAAPAPPAAATSSGDSGDQVSAALRKIASHIGHPKKFAKASQLLRELLSQGALTARHGPLLFSALKAAMAEPGRAADPLLAREYSKLFTAASKVAQVFSVREKNQLDVYGSWAVLRNELNTDDSFQFNKVVARLKEMVEELPQASIEDEAVSQRLAASASAPDPVLAAYDRRHQEEQEAAAAAKPAAAGAAAEEAKAEANGEDVEADPFGLNALMEQQEAEAAAAAAGRAAAAKQPKSATWSSAEVVCQRRAALLDCLDTAKACYRHMWARTSVDLLIEHCYKHKDRFLPSQHERLDELMAFVRDQRRIRKLGPSAKERNRDSTSFERARAEWSRADVSHRGKVGAGGDRGAEAWLG